MNAVITGSNPQIADAWQRHNARSPAALQLQQQAAMAAFSSSGFPTRRMEDWRYTDLRVLGRHWAEWLPNEIQAGTPATAIEGALAIPDALQITLLDGVFHADQRQLQGLAGSLSVSGLGEAACENPTLLERYFGSLAAADCSALVALNAAFSGTGVCIYVPDNVHLKQAVYIHHHVTQTERVFQPRLLVVLGRDSTLELTEHYSASAPAMVNSVTEIFCADGARLQHCRVQSESAQSVHTASQFIELRRHAKAQSAHLEIGGRLVRNELHANLNGEDASIDLTGLYLGDGSRQVETRVSINHRAPHTSSNTRYRGILNDRSRGVFNGRIHVSQAAQKTAAELNNRNLLLAKGAEIDTKPELEIYADDVKCAHGATTGQLDSTAMFYLLSRGIDPAAARSLLITAFAGELLDAYPVDAIRTSARMALQRLQGIAAE